MKIPFYRIPIRNSKAASNDIRLDESLLEFSTLFKYFKWKLFYLNIRNKKDVFKDHLLNIRCMTHKKN